MLAESEAEIIQNTIRLDETAVAQVMTKAEDITSVCITDNMKSVKNVFVESNYSRVPVYDEKRKNIIGILYRADFYRISDFSETSTICS